jgi:hypothetical protein
MPINTTMAIEINCILIAVISDLLRFLVVLMLTNFLSCFYIFLNLKPIKANNFFRTSSSSYLFEHGGKEIVMLLFVFEDFLEQMKQVKKMGSFL